METLGMGRFTINGKTMDMMRTDFSVNRDETERWTVENVSAGMMNVPHSFHVHDVQFHVLSLNGLPPPPSYRGLKDTVLLMGGDAIELQLTFREYVGLYMYHCHFLEHEDAGMMGQFMVN